MTLVQIGAAEAQCSGSNFPSVALRMEVWRDNTGSGVDAALNKESLYGKLMLVKRGSSSAGTSTFSNAGVCSAAAGADGSDRYSAAGLNYDFRSSSGKNATGTVQMLWEGPFDVTHTADGTKTLSFAGQWIGDSNLGTVVVSGSVVLPKITQVPNVPTLVSAVRVSDTSVTVSWSQSHPSNGAATSNVIQARVNGGAWSTVATVSPTTSVSVAAAANQKLEYRVAASNSAGTSSFSSVSSPVYTTPAAPTGVAAVKDAALDITVSWTPNVAYSEHEHAVEESTDGGSSWSALTTVPAGTATYLHDSPNPATTHRYRVRAVNTSGGLSSGWVLSETVQLLAAPNKPTLGSVPVFAAADLDVVLGWTHNPVDTTPQSAFEVQFSTDGGSTWPDTTGKTTSTVSAYTIPADTYEPDDAVSVRVRTWGQATTGGSDSAGGSPWSDLKTVTFKTAPVATVVSPADASTYGEAQLTVLLGFSQAEGATFVQATVTLSDGVSDLETVTSGSLSGIVFSTVVVNGGTYTVTATVLDSNGVRSAPAESTFDVEYTSPVAADAVVSYLQEQGVAQIDLTFPDPGVDETVAEFVSVYRSIDGGVEESIITGYPVDGLAFTLLDTTPTIHGSNVYRVRTISGDGAINDVLVELVTTEPDWAFLSTGAGYAHAIAFRGNLRFGADPARAAGLVTAAGRVKPIALFGVQQGLTVNGSATIWATEGSTVQEVERFLLEADLVCYRDPSGRRMFGQVSGSLETPWALMSEFTYRVVEAT